MASPLHAAFAAPGSSPGAWPIWCVDTESWPARRNALPAFARAFAEGVGFKPEAGHYLLVPGKEGIAGVLFALDTPSKRDTDRFMPGKLASVLPAGTWRFAAPPPDARLGALAFALGRYRFDRYNKKQSKDAKAPRLELPKGVDGADLTRIVEAVYLVRDLINTPANDLGPAELADAARKLAVRHGAKIKVVIGNALKKNFPLVHAVGQGSAREPRLVDFVWGKPTHPKVTLVGKGVVFDTGGLDIKPSSGMLIMKKDMGGAASALGLALLIMSRGLKVRLRVLIPAVENSIAGDAFRPGDVLKSRKGLSVEIGNTDAEGRLVLADALALADTEDRKSTRLNSSH